MVNECAVYHERWLPCGARGITRIAVRDPRRLSPPSARPRRTECGTGGSAAPLDSMRRGARELCGSHAPERAVDPIVEGGCAYVSICRALENVLLSLLLVCVCAVYVVVVHCGLCRFKFLYILEKCERSYTSLV